MALIYTAQNGPLEIVRYLDENHGFGASVQDGDELTLAAARGHLDIVKYLVVEVPEGQRVSADVQNGQALIYAAFYGYLDAVRYLVENEVRADVQGGLVLIEAAKYGHLDTVKYFVVEASKYEQVHINIRNREALAHAEAFGHDSVASYLREKL